MKKCSSRNSVGPKLSAFAVAGDAMRGRIEPQARDLDRVVGQLRRAPAQHRLDARQQLLRRERLGDVIVGARLEARRPCPCSSARAVSMMIGMLAACARRRAAARASATPDWPGSIQSSSTRSGRTSRIMRLGLLGVARAQRSVPGVLEVDRDQLLDRRLVFDDQDRGRACGCARAPCAASRARRPRAWCGGRRCP